MAERALPAGVVTFVVSDGHDDAEVEARDGVAVDRSVAVFGRATDAVAAARGIHMARPGSRAAVHTGEAEPGGGDYGGAARSRAAQLHSMACDGEVLVSESTAALVVDALPAGTRLAALGEDRLRGLDPHGRVFALGDLPAPGTAVGGVPRALAERGVTAKETEVLRAVQAHLRNAEIAARLYVSERTVESHVSSLLRKLHARDRRELARLGASLLGDASHPPGVRPPTTPLIGRVREAAAAVDLLGAARVVTITGTAGVGKTRLALELAATHAGDAWFVELSPVSRDDGVAERVLTALGGEQVPGLDAISSLAARVRAQRMLVVLDNCEHVIAGAAAVARALVDAGRGVAVLATSREPLGVPGETILRLDPLPVPDAARLLVERARAAGAMIDADDDEGVSELCRRLDGLPLALELAAPRLRTFAPAQLVELLDRGERVAGTVRALPERHRTLDDAIDWSYRLLAHDERALFDRLSVFHGSFDVAAATEICGGSVVDVLPRLVDRSLVDVVTVPGGRRYRLLDSLRQYARGHLAAGTTATLRARQGAYAVARAEEAEPKLRGPDVASWIERLRVEQDDLLQAFEWALGAAPEEALRLVAALHLFWEHADLRRPAIAWADRALAATPDAPLRTRVAGLAAAVSLLAPWDQPRARALVREASDAAAVCGDRALVARVQMEEARVEAYGEAPGRVFEPVARALAYFEAAGDRWHCAELLALRSYGEEPEVAVATLADAHARFTLTGDRISTANTAYLLAAAYARRLGDVDRAEPRAQEVLALAAELGSRHEELHGLGVLADCAYLRGDDARTEALAGRCVTGFARLADHRCEARMRLLLAEVALRRGRHVDALDHARSTLAVARLGAHAATIPGAVAVAAAALDRIDLGAAAAVRASTPGDVDLALATIDAAVRTSVLATDAR